MYPVTQDYLDLMKATERRVYAKAEISYTDPFLDQSIQCTANEQANVSYPAQTADAVAEPFAKYAALDGSWVLGEDWALVPGPDEAATKQMGWWGSQLADANGYFAQPYPTLTVTFFSRPITKLQVVGDSKRGEYPVDFVIKLYDASDTAIYTETVTGNTQITWQKTLDNPVTQVVKMTLEISRWSHAGRQVKILEFFTSIQETYEGDDILLIHLLEEREVSQGSLPVGNISANEIDIRLNNSSRKFDAGNKQSPLYQLLKQNRRIRAWLGLRGDGQGQNFSKFETTQADFTSGTLSNVAVTAVGDLELGASDFVDGFSNDTWTKSKKGAFTITYTGSSYQISFPSNTPSSIGDYGQISKTITIVNRGSARLQVDVTDTDIQSVTTGYHFKQILIDGIVVWEDDTSGNEGTLHVDIDISSYISGKSQITIALRVYDKKAVGNYPITVTWDNLRITNVNVNYQVNGYRISPIYDISSVGVAISSAISWTATTPSNTNVIIETNLSLDGGVTWQGWKTCENGKPIPDIVPGINLNNARLQVRQTLSTSDTTVTPILHDMTIRVNHEEWVPLGTFWSGDWSAPEDGVYAQTTGRDRLELLRKSTYSTSQVQQNKTLYDLAVAVLQDAGLKSEEYWVDPELQLYTIPYAYFEPQSHREALRKIAEACLGQVYCDRDGIVRVEGPSYLASKTVADLTITQDDYFRKDNPVKWGEIANYIEVETQPLRPDVTQEVYRSNDPVAVAVGQTLTLTVYYNQTPCINASATLEGATNTVITAATYYAWGANITLQNNGTAAENVTIVINAQPLKVMNKEKAIAKDDASITDNGLIRYTFPANPLVQTLSMAQTIANKLLASFKDPRRDVEVEWRGNPGLLLGDRVSVVDNLETNDYYVIRQEIEYDGALRARLSGRKV